MCGIAGFIELKRGFDPAALDARARRMAAAIAYRGPDAEGAWVSAPDGVALAHRRLAIIDLSAAGAQPMHGAGGRHVIVFNGEIYNYSEVRAALPDQAWRGHSDTEVLLAAIAAWGLEGALGRCAGMFAFGLWDRHERVLTLARDRLGEKPLYYGVAGGALLFGSELKALRAWPEWAGGIDRAALDDFTRHACIHAPRSIYRNVRKLPAACLLRIPLADAGRALELEPRRYWNLERIAAQAPAEIADAEAASRLEVLLSAAVAQQMVADVPVGAFLSGGVDSSLIVALMQAQAKSPVRTFSIGFHEAGYNEAHHAKQVAAHLHTDHTELYVTAGEARAVIPDLSTMYDEPFADSSQIPTHLVCRAARQHVTVALSGDAGDEVFGGYNRYLWAPALWRRVGALPHPLRQALSAGLGALPTGAWDTLLSPWNRQGSALGVARVGEKLHKLSRSIAGVRSLDDVYRRLVSEWQHPAELVIGSQEPPIRLDDPSPVAALTTPEARMMFQDSVGYLPDDILCKVDRAAMAISLETRVPFLDHRVVELAWRLPARMKLRDGVGKWALRELLYRRVPRQLIERPKTGFAIPLGDWLRGPLKAWAQDLLDPDRLRADGLLEPEPVQRRWAAHLAGRGDHTAALWAVLMFQAWQQAQRANAVGAVS